MSPLIVSFKSPHAGWMTASVEADGISVGLEISYTPNDFLEELVSALLAVAETEGTFTANAHEEPSWKTITFQRTGDSVTLSVASRNNPQQELVFVGTPATVVLPLWRALRRLENDQPLSEWQREFPKASMKRLTEVAQKLKHEAA